MGGRGSDSGFRAGGGVTQEQQTIMKRFKKNVRILDIQNLLLKSKMTDLLLLSIQKLG